MSLTKETVSCFSAESSKTSDVFPCSFKNQISSNWDRCFLSSSQMEWSSSTRSCCRERKVCVRPLTFDIRENHVWMEEATCRLINNNQWIQTLVAVSGTSSFSLFNARRWCVRSVRDVVVHVSIRSSGHGRFGRGLQEGPVPGDTSGLSWAAGQGQSNSH